MQTNDSERDKSQDPAPGTSGSVGVDTDAQRQEEEPPGGAGSQAAQSRTGGAGEQPEDAELRADDPGEGG